MVSDFEAHGYQAKTQYQNFHSYILYMQLIYIYIYFKADKLIIFNLDTVIFFGGE